MTPERTDNVIPFGGRETSYFGNCPECGRQDGCVNVGEDHWLVCRVHRTKWWIGSNLFSSWQEETEADWHRHADLLASYREVEPIGVGT